jgi:hypothetical protein
VDVGEDERIEYALHAHIVVQPERNFDEFPENLPGLNQL